MEKLHFLSSDPRLNMAIAATNVNMTLSELNPVVLWPTSIEENSLSHRSLGEI